MLHACRQSAGTNRHRLQSRVLRGTAAAGAALTRPAAARSAAAPQSGWPRPAPLRARARQDCARGCARARAGSAPGCGCGCGDWSGSGRGCARARGPGCGSAAADRPGCGCGCGAAGRGRGRGRCGRGRGRCGRSCTCKGEPRREAYRPGLCECGADCAWRDSWSRLPSLPPPSRPAALLCNHRCRTATHPRSSRSGGMLLGGRPGPLPPRRLRAASSSCAWTSCIFFQELRSGCRGDGGGASTGSGTRLAARRPPAALRSAARHASPALPSPARSPALTCSCGRCSGPAGATPRR